MQVCSYVSLRVCKYASMTVCQYARMQVYTCLYKNVAKRSYNQIPQLCYHFCTYTFIFCKCSTKVTPKSLKTKMGLKVVKYIVRKSQELWGPYHAPLWYHFCTYTFIFCKCRTILSKINFKCSTILVSYQDLESKI